MSASPTRSTDLRTLHLTSTSRFATASGSSCIHLRKISATQFAEITKVVVQRRCDDDVCFHFGEETQSERLARILLVHCVQWAEESEPLTPPRKRQRRP